MADVLNRTTDEYLKSVNTPDYPVADWIINPDAAAIQAAADRRAAARPPPGKSDEQRLVDIETRVAALERI